MTAKIETLQDRFLSGSLDTSVWSDSSSWDGSSFPGTASFSFGEMTIPTSGGGITSVGSYDLTGSGVSAELLHADSTAQNLLLVSPDRINYAYIKVAPANSSGPLAVIAGHGAPDDEMTLINYDISKHRFLRLCENSGTLYFDVSGDGLNWQNIASVPTPFTATSVAVSVYAGGIGSGANSGQWGNIGYVPVSSRYVSPGFGVR
jgi:hypothetical protein